MSEGGDYNCLWHFQSAAFQQYLGQVSTRVVVPDNKNSAVFQMRGIRWHYFPNGAVNPRFTFPNYYVDGAHAALTYTELGLGAASTVTAAIQNISGTILGQITFGGIASGTIPNLDELTSDTLAVTLAPGWYGVRYWWSNPNGILFTAASSSGTNVGANRLLGDNLDIGAGATDNTMGGAYTATSGTNGYGPNGITAMTTQPSILIFDDSLGYGERDTGDLTGDVGFVPRIFGTNGLNLAYSCYGVAGDGQEKWNLFSAIRRKAISRHSHLVMKLGINSFVNFGASASSIRTVTQATKALIAPYGKPCFIAIMTPGASSSNDYADIAGQTLPTWAAARVTENTARRNNVDGWAGIIDIASIMESSLNSGFWMPAVGYMAPPPTGTNYLHPVKTGYDAPRAAGLVSPSLFT